MDFKFVTGKELDTHERNSIRNLVELYDSEFIPPLSARKSTTEKNLSGCDVIPSTEPYYNGLLEQNFILAVNDGNIVGFMSYIPKKHLVVDGKLDVSCEYISTIIVEEQYRNKGLTTEMYQTLMKSKDPKTTYATRTWSCNFAHIKVLKNLGFGQILKLENDRGPGIDTLYYLKLN